MIQLTAVQRILDSTKKPYSYEMYKAPEREEAFRDCLREAREKKPCKTSKQCEQEVWSLWLELSKGCNRLKLLVHPNVYDNMANDEAYGRRIMDRLSSAFSENSILYPSIMLAMLDAEEVNIMFSHNGDISYSTSGAA